MSLSERISEAIARLRALSQISVQSDWCYLEADAPQAKALDSQHWPTWIPGTVNARDHHPWIKGNVPRWFAQTIIVPEHLNGYPLKGMCLRLGLLWWAVQAEVYVNGKLVQEGDLFDCAPRLLLSPSVRPGDRFEVALHFISPGHDDGALMKSVCYYESTTSDRLEPGFIADELAVLEGYLTAFEPGQLAVLDAAIAQIAWSALPHDAAEFDQSLENVRQTLLPLAQPIQQRQIQLLGHAHLDMAWLWSVEDTWEAAERTFRSVLKLQKDFPDLTFCHSTPALYEWVEQNLPDLFTEIQTQVQQGTWEPIGGLWIEPELNLINGEAIARHILYGQQYFQAKFGSISRFAWLPDTFGFNWQLPQLLKQGGIDCFVTQKLRWNDTTKFPHELFAWQAPDGTSVLAWMSAPIGEGVDPLKMTHYAWAWEQKTGLTTSLWLPGVGDHGGGPTRDMLEVARRWQRSPFFPKMEFTTAESYLHELEEPAVGKKTAVIDNLPVWNSELYLEFHRGCYTTHADQKQFNRRLEKQLFAAELWASLATIATAAPYPKQALEQAWKQTLFNQFHDILPGTSITPVFVEANQTWQAAEAQTTAILEQALQAIAQQIDLSVPPHPDAQPIVVFNALNWERTAIVDLDVPPQIQVQQVYDADGKPLLFSQTPTQVTVRVPQIPAVGYTIVWLLQQVGNVEADAAIAQPFVLENEFLIVEVDTTTGDLTRLFDKRYQREVLNGLGNQIQAFTDGGQYWDAWNIDPAYAEKPLLPPELKSIQWVEQNAVRSRLRVTRQLNQSTFTQDYVLETQSPLLKIHTQIDWHEKHILVKAAFPLSLEADFATYEIPCGAIQRTTKPQTEAEKAQWEVPALHWADLSNGAYGVSLLTDCKYGFDATPNQLRLTLLRGIEWPDPEADKGQHSFTYVIYPHDKTWQQAQTVLRGYELNVPVQTISASVNNPSNSQCLPKQHSFFNLGAKNLILMALKQTEDAEAWILRCYECQGDRAELNFNNRLNLNLEGSVDLLERPTDSLDLTDPVAKIRPWQVASFKLSLTKI